MKNGLILILIGFLLVLSVSGCANAPPPVWQQELNNINRQWRAEPAPVIKPFKVPHSDVLKLRYQCGFIE